MMNAFDLGGRTALVTGGNRGIGYSIARALGTRGARIAVVNRDPESGGRAVAKLAEEGVAADYFQLDLGDLDAIEPVVQAVERRFGRIDILVNNAAMRVGATALEHTASSLEEILKVNVSSVFLLSQAFARLAVAEKRKGAIINISSVVAEKGMLGRCSYVISKGAIDSLCIALAVEWAEHGVRVNNVAPGMVQIPERAQQQMANAARWSATLDHIPAGRVATPEDIACATVFLASDAADYVTGQTLRVDGGWSLTALPMSIGRA